MKYQMKLNPDSFEEIKSGKKFREYRLNDEKRQKIKIGDTIEFLKLPDLKESIEKEVEAILLYKNFHSCYEDFFEEDLSEYYKNIEEAIKDTYENWWSKEDEEKYGCLIFKLKK